MVFCLELEVLGIIRGGSVQFDRFSMGSILVRSLISACIFGVLRLLLLFFGINAMIVNWSNTR